MSERRGDGASAYVRPEHSREHRKRERAAGGRWPGLDSVARRLAAGEWRSPLQGREPPWIQPVSRQATQFELHKRLAVLGVPLVDDPLFACKIEPLVPGTAGVEAEIVYRGLRVKGVAEEDRLVEVFLEGRLLRRERIEPRSRPCRYRLYANRPSLALFPPTSQLLVRASDPTSGRVFGESRFGIEIPHGNGRLVERFHDGAIIDKKGDLRGSREEISVKQEMLLSLYRKARPVFRRLAGKRLFLMYGTLLGLHRDGDLIPWDEDFDVGYVSNHTAPEAVKREVEEMMASLVREGFTISLNRRGKPFRLHDRDGDPRIYLDVCPVRQRNGRVWTNPYGSLKMSLDAFRRVENRSLRDTRVEIPRGTETFLREYYGPGWKTPDPDYSRFKTLAPEDESELEAICLRPKEISRLQSSLRRESGAYPERGRLHSKALFDLYPLDLFAAICGWD